MWWKIPTELFCDCFIIPLPPLRQVRVVNTAKCGIQELTSDSKQTMKQMTFWLAVTFYKVWPKQRFPLVSSSISSAENSAVLRCEEWRWPRDLTAHCELAPSSAVVLDCNADENISIRRHPAAPVEAAPQWEWEDQVVVGGWVGVRGAGKLAWWLDQELETVVLTLERR